MIALPTNHSPKPRLSSVEPCASSVQLPPAKLTRWAGVRSKKATESDAAFDDQGVDVHEAMMRQLEQDAKAFDCPILEQVTE